MLCLCRCCSHAPPLCVCVYGAVKWSEWLLRESSVELLLSPAATVVLATFELGRMMVDGRLCLEVLRLGSASSSFLAVAAARLSDFSSSFAFFVVAADGGDCGGASELEDELRSGRRLGGEVERTRSVYCSGVDLVARVEVR